MCWHLFHTESDELAFIFDSISNLVKVRAGGLVVFFSNISDDGRITLIVKKKGSKRCLLRVLPEN